MRRAALLFVPLLLFACDREPVAPDATPSFDGASIYNEIQIRHPVRRTWLDADRDAGEPGDVRLLGFEPADHAVCNGGVWGGIEVREHIVVSHMPDDFDLGDASTWNQGEGLHDLVTIIGTAPLYMYYIADVPVGATDEELCEFYKNGWVASGHWTATIYKDNDYTFLDYTPGMNVYGTNEHGVLRGRDGTKYKYLWKWLAQYNPETGVDRMLYNFDHVERVGK